MTFGMRLMEGSSDQGLTVARLSCSNSYLQLPADFRPVVLTGDGRSASGKCFDIGYYKQVGGACDHCFGSCPKMRCSLAAVAPYSRHVGPPAQMSPELIPLDDHIALQHFAAKGQFEGICASHLMSPWIHHRLKLCLRSTALLSASCPPAN